jgi:hypothetical protein
MIGVLQPEKIRAVNSNCSRQKEITGEQGMLGPETVPPILQYFNILEIIKCPHKSRENRKNKKSQPYRAAS